MINTTQKQDEVTSKTFKHYTGVIPYNVIAINPSLEQLEKLGVNFNKEPNYLLKNEDTEELTTIVDVWLKAIPTKKFPELNFITNVRFFISHNKWVGPSGKTQFINAYGKTAWAESKKDLDQFPYFDNTGVREAHRGEELLSKFLFSWLNMVYTPQKKNECQLNIDKFIRGNFTELQSLVPKFSTYVVQCLTGVEIVSNDSIKIYQKVYNKYFLNVGQTSSLKMYSYVNSNEYNEFKSTKGDLKYTYEIKEYIPKLDEAATPDPDSELESDLPFDEGNTIVKNIEDNIDPIDYSDPETDLNNFF